MPLIKGKSKGAFEHNLKAEMHAGKPQKQALAIAYATKRRAMKAHGGYMAEGGQITDNYQSAACEYCTMDGTTQMEHSPECQTQSHSEGMLHQGKESFPPGAYHMAEGGEAKEEPYIQEETNRMHGGLTSSMGSTGPTGYRNRNKASDLDSGQRKGPEGYPKYQEQAQNQKGVHIPISGVTSFPGGKGTSQAGSYTKERWGGKPLFSGKDHPAIEEHKRILSEMKAMPNPKLMAEGGEPDSTEQQPDESTMGAGLVDRIMAKRMSEGGKVANEDHGPMDSRLSGFDQNEFDDLALRDDLEFSYNGANSGDEKGDTQEDDDRKDIVARIMKSRGKKDRMPR
jgi:hypothetical protein